MKIVLPNLTWGLKMLVEIQVHADLFSLCFTSSYLGMVLLWNSYGSLMIFLWPVDGFARVFWCFCYGPLMLLLWSFDAFAMVSQCLGPLMLVLWSSYVFALVSRCFGHGPLMLLLWSSDASAVVFQCLYLGLQDACAMVLLLWWFLLYSPKYFVMVFLCFCRGLLLFPCALRASAHGT